jgi:hypothetical protein
VQGDRVFLARTPLHVPACHRKQSRPFPPESPGGGALRTDLRLSLGVFCAKSYGVSRSKAAFVLWIATLGEF